MLLLRDHLGSGAYGLKASQLWEHSECCPKASKARGRWSPELGTNTLVPPGTWQWHQATPAAPSYSPRSLHTWAEAGSHCPLHTLETTPVACLELFGPVCILLVHLSVCEYTYMYACVYTYMCVHTCMCVCKIYMYAYGTHMYANVYTYCLD